MGAGSREAEGLRGSLDTISTFCNILTFGVCQRKGPIGLWKVTKKQDPCFIPIYIPCLLGLYLAK